MIFANNSQQFRNEMIMFGYGRCLIDIRLLHIFIMDIPAVRLFNHISACDIN